MLSPPSEGTVLHSSAKNLGMGCAAVMHSLHLLLLHIEVGMWYSEAALLLLERSYRAEACLCGVDEQ